MYATADEAGLPPPPPPPGKKRFNWDMLISFFLFVVVLCPIAVCLTAALFGFILAGVEKWALSDGFYYVVSNLTGGWETVYVSRRRQQRRRDACCAREGARGGGRGGCTNGATKRGASRSPPVVDHPPSRLVHT
jgi:hypothetical protein